MRVASQVLRFVIPVLDLLVVVGDAGVTSIVVGGINVMGVEMVFDIVGVMVISISMVGNMVKAIGGMGGCIVPVVGFAFIQEISPLGIYSCATMCWRMVQPLGAV